MTIMESIFSGVAGLLIATWWAYHLQKKLLARQEQFQQRLLDQQLAAQEKAGLDQALGDNSLVKQVHTEGQAIKDAIESLKK